MNKDLILLKAKMGDEEAKEEIIKLYQSMVYKQSRQFFLKGGDFEDLLQEGFIGLIKAIEHYEEEREASFLTFATLFVRRQIITAVKKSNVEKYRKLNEAIDIGDYSKKEDKIFYEAPSLAFYSPEEVLLGKELFELLQNHLNDNLSKLEREVFYYLFHQFSYIEIAEALDTTPKRIDNTIQRVKRKIYNYLESYIS